MFAVSSDTEMTGAASASWHRARNGHDENTSCCAWWCRSRMRCKEIDSNAPCEDATASTDRQRQWRGERLPEVGDLAPQEAWYMKLDKARGLSIELIFVGQSKWVARCCHCPLPTHVFFTNINIWSCQKTAEALKVQTPVRSNALCTLQQFDIHCNKKKKDCCMHQSYGHSWLGVFWVQWVWAESTKLSHKWPYWFFDIWQLINLTVTFIIFYILAHEYQMTAYNLNNLYK